METYPLVLSNTVLSEEVPYGGEDAEWNYYVEGLRFLDKDFDGFVRVHISLLEPVSRVRSATFTIVFNLCFLLFFTFVMLKLGSSCAS